MHTLTTRGRALLATGLVLVGVGWGVGQASVITMAALLISVPVIGAVLVRRSRFVLGSARTISPARFPVGGEAEVVLAIENGSRFATGVLLLEDLVPESLGESPRILLDRVPPRAQRSQRYCVTGLERGRTAIGPLTVTLADPFGMASLTRAFTGTNSVMVTPEIVELGRMGRSIAPGGQGETLFRSLAARGDDDVLPREHRPGDDMRRIHWRATARSGDLMVRREEQAWHSSMVIILDNRERGHHGAGTTSTFEWAVSAAASVAVHYQRMGWRLTVLTSGGHLLVEASGTSGAEIDAVLQAFSDVRLTSEPMATRLTAATDGASAVVAVVGRATDDALTALVRPMAGFAGCLLLEPGPVDRLRAQGWQVTPWHRGRSVAEAWGELTPSATAGLR